MSRGRVAMPEITEDHLAALPVWLSLGPRALRVPNRRAPDGLHTPRGTSAKNNPQVAGLGRTPERVPRIELAL